MKQLSNRHIAIISFVLALSCSAMYEITGFYTFIITSIFLFVIGFNISISKDFVNKTGEKNHD